MRKNKRGAELSMNVIIIAILVVLVLVIVAVFFTGGFTTLSSKIKNLFQPEVIDLQTAVTKCNGYCTSYEVVTGVSIQRDLWRKFCEDPIDIDLNGNRKIDSGEQKLCYQLTSCSAIDCNNMPT